MRRSVVLFCSLVLMVAAVVAAASGYVIILKNGSRIRAREPLKIEGRNAIITLITGTMTSYPLDQIDLVATERYNRMGFGDALTIDGLGEETRPMPTITPTRPLGSLAQLDTSLGGPVLGSTVEPTPTPTPGITLRNRAYHDPRVEQAFAQILDDKKLYQYRTSVGTQPDYLFIRTVTDTQREVFKSLQVVCEAFTLIHDLHPEISPAVVELEMVTLSNKPAGVFRIMPEDAKMLSSGETSVEQFYVQHVMFR